MRNVRLAQEQITAERFTIALQEKHLMLRLASKESCCAAGFSLLHWRCCILSQVCLTLGCLRCASANQNLAGMQP